MGKKQAAPTGGQKLTPEQYKAIAAAVIELHKEQRVQEIKNSMDERMGNVRLLLQNYRKFKTYAQNAICSIKEAKLILADMMYEVNTLDDELKIESIIRTKERTLVMVAHIEKMMSIYKTWCYSCGEDNAERRCNIIFDRYIVDSTVKPSAERLAEKYDIERTTVFNDLNRAYEELGPIMFGILQDK